MLTASARRGIYLTYGLQLITISTSLASLPILVAYLGKESYGAWVVVSTVATYFTLLNLGIPTAVTVLTAQAETDGERRRLLQDGAGTLAAVAGLGLLTLLTIDRVWPFTTALLGDLPPVLGSEAGKTLLVICSFVLVKNPLSVYIAALAGLQRPDLVKAYEIATALAVFVALVAATRLDAGLLGMAWASSIAGLLVSAAAACHYAVLSRPRSPMVGVPVANRRRLLLRNGFNFLQVGVAATLVWSTDMMVISHLLGVEAVAPYSVAFRLYVTGFMIFSAVNGVLMPAYGRALARNDWQSIRASYEGCRYLLPVIGGGVWIGGLLLAEPIIALWSGSSDMFGGLLLIYALGAYGYIFAFVNTFASLLTGLDHSGPIVRVGWLEALSNLCLTLLLVPWLGIGGAALATAAAALLFPFTMFPRIIARASGAQLGFDLRHFIVSSGCILLPLTIAAAVLSQRLDGSNRLLCAVILLSIWGVASWKMMPLEPRSRLAMALAGRLQR